MLALEIAALDATGVRRTLRWATGAGMTTKPSDLPANTTFFPGVIQPGRITRSLFRPTGETFGTSDLNFGVVEVANDGDWDPLLGWAFDGQTITIRRGSVGDPFPAGWTEVLTGRIDGVEFGQRTITFYIRDAQADVFEALLTEETFAGDNTLPAGIEGTADDVKGLYKPVAYGTVRNAQATNVNTALFIHQHRVPTDLSVATSAVYDRGVLLTQEADYGALADIQTTTPSPGAWRAYEGSHTEGAYLRLGSRPDALVTVDLAVGTPSEQTAAQVLRRVLLDAGVDSAAISGVDALDAVVSYGVGYYNTESETRAKDVLEIVAASVHGYVIAKRDGTFAMARLSAPAGQSKTTFGVSDLLDPSNALTRITGPIEGIPVYRVTVRYQRNWTPQEGEEIDRSSVSEARREYLRQSYRSITVTDDKIKARHPYAREIDIETVIDTEADATEYAGFLLSLYGTRRDIYTIKLDGPRAGGVDLGDVITLQVPRFDLTRGKQFVVTGIDEDLGENTATITLWG